jgi:hypothetical protein
MKKYLRLSSKMAKNKQERMMNKTLLKTAGVLKKYGLLRAASGVLSVDRNRFIRAEKEKRHGPHKLALSTSTMDSVQAFYEDHATPLPHKKAFSKKLGKAGLI